MALSPYQRPYTYAPENALFFSRELFEYVLKEFGFSWTAKCTEREDKLREVATHVFTPEIGKLIDHLSIKYGSLVVMRSLDIWNYIKSHRQSVWEKMLVTSIINLCERSKFETNDEDLLIFMAIVVDLARLLLLDLNEHLVTVAVETFSYCLTDLVAGGFLSVLELLQRNSLKYTYPDTSENLNKSCQVSPGSSSSNPDHHNTSLHHNHLNILKSDYFPNYVTMEEIKDNLQKRENMRSLNRSNAESYPQRSEFFRGKDITTQTDISEEHSVAKSLRKQSVIQTLVSFSSKDMRQTPSCFESFGNVTRAHFESGEAKPQNVNLKGGGDARLKNCDCMARFHINNKVEILITKQGNGDLICHERDQIDVEHTGTSKERGLESPKKNLSNITEVEVENQDVRVWSKNLKTSDLPVKVKLDVDHSCEILQDIMKNRDMCVWLRYKTCHECPKNE